MASFRPGSPEHIFLSFLNTEQHLRQGYSGSDQSVVVSQKFLRVQIPVRIGLAVKDMTTFAPKQPGGGGVGLSLNTYSATDVFVAPSASAEAQKTVTSGSRPLVLAHSIAVFRRALLHVGLNSLFFSVVAMHTPAVDAHCGLGSTSGAALGVLFALNTALGNVFSRDAVRLMLAHNYVEEASPDEVAFGYETTMTAVGAIGGGVFVIGENLDVLARNVHAFAANDGIMMAPVIVFLPNDEQQPPQQQQPEQAQATEAAVLSEGAVGDAAVADEKQMVFANILIPELRRGSQCNLEAVRNAINTLTLSGSKMVEIQRHPRANAVKSFLSKVAAPPVADDVLMAGMSSIGPACVVMLRPGRDTAATRAELLAFASQANMSLALDTTLNAHGLLVAEYPLPQFLAVLGAPCAGKSTLCSSVQAALGSHRVRHFAVGTFLRSFVSSSSSPDAAVIAQIMTAGEVADRGGCTARVLLGELFRLVGLSGCGSVVLLDGFPRSAAQLSELVRDFGIPLVGAVVVRASDATRARRASLRPSRPVAAAAEPAADVRSGFDETHAMLERAHQLGVRVSFVDNDSDDDSAADKLAQLVARLAF